MRIDVGAIMRAGRVQVVQGDKIRGFAGAWYRHDTVVLDGVALEGWIQVRRRARSHTIDVITGFGNACVLGSDIAWLIGANSRTVEQ